MVEFKDIRKRFGRLEVLNGIDLHLEPGMVHVVMGPNGSGKTTLIKCLLGLVRPDSGDIRVQGEAVLGHWAYRAAIGYMPQIARFPENLSPTELVKMVQDLRQNKGNPEPFIREFRLGPHMKKPMRNLSGGTRQKVNATLALMYDVPLYVFDEPTSGFDPVACLFIKDTIRSMVAEGKTVLLITHVMSEIEELADRITFLLEGRIHLSGTPASIREGHRAETLERAIARILIENEQL